jgi:rhamnulokinase
MLPPIVSAGTTLGPLRPDIAKETRLEDARVLSSCSHDLAATLTALPVDEHETCAFLQPGRTTLLGVQVDAPIISDGIRELRYTNESGYNGAVCFYKRLPGLWILEECRRYWKDTDRDVDGDMLTHLAGSAPPFESLINPADPRFLTPGEMPLKIQAFCKDTGQAAPRKPGPVYRCILESLALYYRKIFEEIEQLTGGRVNRVNILGSGAPPLLNHFITNACQLPALVVPEQATAAGNILIQAIGLGHIKSIAQAREVVRNSIKMETLLPHANAWNSAYDRLVSLSDVEQAEALDE